jgi:glutamine amidotransferase-like uncharacterized protein
MSGAGVAEAGPGGLTLNPQMRMAILWDPVKLEQEEPGYPSATLETVLRKYAPDVTLEVITVHDLLAGCLSNATRGITALCIPGGFALNYASRLGLRGIELIRQFVACGGGYMGICAGAYLGSTECLGEFARPLQRMSSRTHRTHHLRHLCLS